MDKSLEEIIQENKKNRGGRGGGRGGRRGGSGPGPMRRGRVSRRRNSTPYGTSAMEIDEDVWQHDKYVPEDDNDMDSGLSFKRRNRIRRLNRITGGYQTGYKLRVSNLHFDVSTEDIKDLFSKVGDLKRAVVHYDKSGRSLGTAEVVFSRKQDALNALKKFNNNPLDGRVMKVELLGPNVISRGTRGNRVPGQNRRIRITAERTLTRLWSRGGRFRSRGGSRGGGPGSTRGGGRRGGFGNRGRGGRGASRNRGVNSKEGLDQELDEYISTN